MVDEGFMNFRGGSSGDGDSEGALVVVVDTAWLW